MRTLLPTEHLSSRAADAPPTSSAQCVTHPRLTHLDATPCSEQRITARDEGASS